VSGLLGQLRRARRDNAEEGSALVIALLFLAVFGLLIGGILSLTQANLKTTGAIRARASNDYTGAAAVDGAVNYARNVAAVGGSAYDQTCFSLPAATVNANTQVDVRCTGRSGSGTSTSPFPASASQPSQAILGTSVAANADGLVVAAATSAHVQGPVAIAHTLNVGLASTVTATPGASSPVSAQTCTITGTVTPAPNCASITVPTDPATDATYPFNSSWVPNIGYPAPVAAMPACNGNRVATFSPGTYSNLAALAGVFSACAGGAFWFQPGIYYFDFLDAGAASHDWTLADANADIVGGAPSASWNPATFVATAGILAPFPSSDATSGTSSCDPTKQGVLFVFGNDSRFTLTNGHVQLCAYAIGATAQHLAVWNPGVTTTAIGSTVQLIAANNSTDTTAAGGVAWTNPQNGSVLGSGLLANVVANTTPSTLTTQSGSWTIPAGAIPASATITSVSLTVYDTLGALAGTGFGKSTLKVTPGGGVATTVTVKDCTLGCANRVYAVNPTVVTVPMTTAAQVNGMSIAYSVTGAPSLAGWVDGISVAVNYTAPLRAPSGVLTKAPYSPLDVTTDGVIVVNGAVAARPMLSIHGTVYAPATAVSITQTGVANDVVDRGIVARDTYLALSLPAAAYTGPHISIPLALTTTLPRDVLFTAVMGGVTLLRSEVKFSDATGLVDGAVPSVITWSEP
jgi:hypothetical protein